MIYVPYYFEDPQHADHCVRWVLEGHIEVYHFFVPHRLQWAAFEEFLCDL